MFVSIVYLFGTVSIFNVALLLVYCTLSLKLWLVSYVIVIQVNILLSICLCLIKISFIKKKPLLKYLSMNGCYSLVWNNSFKKLWTRKGSHSSSINTAN